MLSNREVLPTENISSIPTVILMPLILSILARIVERILRILSKSASVIL